MADLLIDPIGDVRTINNQPNTMSTENKDLVAVLLGAALGLGAYNCIQSRAAQQQTAASVRDKFHQLKDETEKSSENVKNYFAELKVKTADLFKEHFPDLLQCLEAVFENRPKDTISDSPTTEVNPAA
jgi:hypothetical protein